MPEGDADNSGESAGIVGRLRAVSVSAATKKIPEATKKIFEYDPAPGMWAATGSAIAHAPNLTDLRSQATGGDQITFDANGLSTRDAPPEVLKSQYLTRVATRRASVPALEAVLEQETGTERGDLSGKSSGGTEVNPADVEHLEQELHAKAPWSVTIKHGLFAFWKFFITPTGFLVTLYGLNVVAWGAMLFFLELHAAPAMNHPDHGNDNSSPRKIWLEIDSQILNALFCLTAWGLAPWRFRDFYWVCVWRFSRNAHRSKAAIRRLAARNSSWFRMRDSDYEEGTVDEALHREQTFSGVVAPPTKTWKMDFVVIMMVSNSLLQVGMAFFMWHWNRIDRPGWGTGTFIGLGCAVSLFAGIMSWWEGRKVKIIEGPRVKTPKDEES
ncbi:hypothetical protein MBLNU459_g6486t1 [Dothideomycetes sp. NU459]